MIGCGSLGQLGSMAGVGPRTAISNIENGAFLRKADKVTLPYILLSWNQGPKTIIWMDFWDLIP